MTYSTSRFCKLAASVAAGLCVAGSAWAQAYPNKTITLVVPFSAGGPTDVVARTLGAAMTKSLGQTVIVENKTGAGGTLAAAYAARATPDGYTFLIHHNGMATAPALYRKLSYKPLADFEYVSQVIDVPMTLVGRKDLPANNFKELQAFAKANGDKVNLAHAGLGAVSHLCGMLLRQAMGVEMTTIPFQGTGPAMNALLGGQVDLLCDQTTSTTPFIKAGNVKLYGVTTPQRLKTLPDTPTLAEQGLTGFQVVVWHGIYAPKGTPKEARDKFAAALRTALKDPAVVQRMAELGAVIPSDDKLTSAGLQTWLEQETVRYAPVIKAAGQFADWIHASVPGALDMNLPDLRRSETHLVDGLVGAIEVLFDVPSGPAAGVAIVAHPQPLLGGSARHKVPQVLARGLVEKDWLVARPNFRGVGGSMGVHDVGVGETEDLVELAHALRRAHPDLPLALVGFSFGAFVQAWVASRLFSEGFERLSICLAGMPFGQIDGQRSYETPSDFPDALVIHGEMDQRVPLQSVLDWARPQSRPVVVVPDADHFFTGRLPTLRALVVSHLIAAHLPKERA